MKDQETKHTPTPYEINEGQIFVGYSGDASVLIESKVNKQQALMGEPVCKVFGNKQTALKTAAFIVKACNSYDEMLEALKEAEKELRFHNWQNTNAYNKITAAIQKATPPVTE